MTTYRRDSVKGSGARLKQPVAGALRLVRRLVGTLQSSARAVEQRTGVTNAQLFLLRALEERRQLSLGELAELAGTQQSTASLVVKRLVRSGLVRRQLSPEDGRRVLLSLTPRGRTKLRHAPVPATARLLEALEGLTAPELRALTRGLEALERELGPRPDEPGMLFEAPGRK